MLKSFVYMYTHSVHVKLCAGGPSIAIWSSIDIAVVIFLGKCNMQ